MSLTLALHPVIELRFGSVTQLEGTLLQIDREDLSRLILEDGRLASVELEIVHSGEMCRAGIVFDVIEPRAKEPGFGVDFPGILGPMVTAGQGTTHVLQGIAVTVLDEGAQLVGGAGAERILEMGGPASEWTPFSRLQHLIVVPHARPNLERPVAQHALRGAALKVPVYLAQRAIGTPPAATEVFDLENQGPSAREGLPRTVYIAQVYAHQKTVPMDAQILYGHNTAGMMPVPLHPNEWLDGALVAPYGGAETYHFQETYFYQNHPIILELYRRHQKGELTFAGTIATVAVAREEDRDRNAMIAANLANWDLGAEAAILTNYGGGAPHVDMALMARACEVLGIRTAVQVSDMTRDRRVESAFLFNFPEVNAIVYGGGNDTKWEVPAVERVIAGNAALAEALSESQRLNARNICGVINFQGAQRLCAVAY